MRRIKAAVGKVGMGLFGGESRKARRRRWAREADERARIETEEQRKAAEQQVREDQAASAFRGISHRELLERFRAAMSPHEDLPDGDPLTISVLTTILASQRLDDDLEELAVQAVAAQQDMHSNGPPLEMPPTPLEVKGLARRIESIGGRPLLLLISKRVYFVEGRSHDDGRTLFAPEPAAGLFSLVSGLERSSSYMRVVREWKGTEGTEG